MNDKCPACGTAYAEHLGLIGTCEKLQILREALEEIARGDTICQSWRDTRLPQCDKIAKEALQRAGDDK